MWGCANQPCIDNEAGRKAAQSTNNTGAERVGSGGEGAKCSDATEEMKQLVFYPCFQINIPKAELSLHISTILQVVNKRGSKEN